LSKLAASGKNLNLTVGDLVSEGESEREGEDLKKRAKTDGKDQGGRPRNAREGKDSCLVGHKGGSRDEAKGREKEARSG